MKIGVKIISHKQIKHEKRAILLALFKLTL